MSLPENPPRNPTWKELIEAREAEERKERERQLEVGRVALAKWKSALKELKENGD